MHCVVCKAGAVDVINGGDRARSNDVRRVNIEGAPALGLEVCVDGVAQVDADVTVNRVPGGVLLAGGHMGLASTLSDYDHHISLLGQHGVDVRQHVVHVDFDLGHENEIDEVRCERSVGSDKACITAHKLHDADALIAARGLDPAIPNDTGGSLDRGVKAKGSINEEDVVVDRLRHPDDADLKLLLPGLLVKQVASKLRAVAADDKQHVDPELTELGADFGCVEAAAACLEYRAALHVNLLNKLWCELDVRVMIRV
mmetsp:Transcript_1803/g.5125  ORF Transcript_1803/g.5125 Transcript_1803/m.5125 type:complete len:256 (-) Transcript_1803:723-1490(-)